VESIPAKDSTKFSLSGNVRYTEKICDMYLLLRKWKPGSLNAYLADSCIIKVPNPTYNITEVVDPICQMTGATTIGEQPIKDYKYTWSPATYLNIANKARVAFGYDWQGAPYYGENDKILIYKVEIKRPSGCSSTDTVFVPLKPLPFVTQPANAILCDGEHFRVQFADPNSSETTYEWTADGGLTAGFAPSGSSNVIDVAEVHNTGNQPQIVTIQVTPKRAGCLGEAKIFFVTINPKPSIYMVSDQINCAGAMVPATTISGNLADALYKWERKSGDAVVGNSGLVIIPAYIAQNTDPNNPKVGYYRAWAEYNYGKKCYSDTVNFTITIEPMPTVETTGNTELCSGAVLDLKFAGTPANNTYQYQKVSGGNISGLSSIGVGNINVASAVNPSNNSTLTSVYKVTPVSASKLCMGTEDNITINIYPIPTISSLKALTICSGETFSYTLTSPVSGASLTWENV
jgi:hypothetical protein